MLMHQLVQGYQFLGIRKHSFPVFMNFPSVSKHQASKEMVLILFCSIFSFQLIGITFAHHNKRKNNSTINIRQSERFY